ncbi:4-(cytidine 5'-diphospho)-2-C-methyl-D-erythritol kinase [Sphingobacterium sp. LRF_L2]|uniref:4-(cytidine 5'-diphospho)-2-C-methyl-D-erythritol kinase n=1 Tax=Sphingobacterium sp. LRF_L2 TaxID=3369421 RepID=UPI003F62EDD9
MISYANAKINVGLNIIGKRPDGYHDLQTVFYPFPLYDIIEMHEKKEGDTSLMITGMRLPLDDNNLCLRAYRLLKQEFDLPAVGLHLHKRIPFGAGLGGGSSDAAAVLKMLNERFTLGLTFSKLEAYAGKLGADCPFFIQNTPVYGEGIGTTFSAIDLDLSSKYLVLIKPAIHVSTAEAYSGVIPCSAEEDLMELLRLPVQEWKFHVKNDFEDSLFEKYPVIRDAKIALYEAGALYASMSGSGSAVYGIFAREVDLSALKTFGDVYYPIRL